MTSAVRRHESALLADVRALHENIRARVAERLTRARATGHGEGTSQPMGWGAGDRVYALDQAADEALVRFVERVGRRQPIALVAEGAGLLRGGSGATDAVRVLVDPIDGTRGLMLDMRSGWALSGVAPDRGEATRLSQIELAVQTELPSSAAGVYHVLVARAGLGAEWFRHDVASGACLDQGPLRVRQDVSLDNGVFAFTRYLALERPHVAALEQRFLQRAIPELGLDPHLIYDDQYLCTAGQLFLCATGRYRLLADLRAWLGRTRSLANFAVKPYDLASLLIFREAGLPVCDAEGAPLDGPFDTETALDVVAYGNQGLRRAFEPLLRAAMGG